VSYAGLADKEIAFKPLKLKPSLRLVFGFVMFMIFAVNAAVAGTLTPESATLEAQQDLTTGIDRDGTQKFVLTTDPDEFLSGVLICNPDCQGSDKPSDKFSVGPWSVDYECIPLDVGIADDLGNEFQRPCTINVSFAAGSKNNQALLSVLTNRLKAPTVQERSTAKLIGTNTLIEEPPREEFSTLSFARAAVTVAESVGTLSLRLSRGRESKGPVSVAIRATDRSASSPEDYFLSEPINGGRISWEANDYSDKEIEISIVQDDIGRELTESFELGLFDFRGAVPGRTPFVIVSIENVVNPLPVGSFSFQQASHSVTEGDSPIMPTVTRSNGQDGLVLLEVQAFTESSTTGADFQLGNSLLRWPSGDSQPKSVTFTALDDQLLNEQTEPVVLVLNPFQGGGEDNARSSEATFGANRSTTVNIQNRMNEGGTFAFNVSASSVPREDGVVRVSVRRTGGSDGPANLRVFSADGTAVAGRDYAPVDRVLSWTDGESADKLVAVRLLGRGNNVQSVSTFTLNLAQVVGDEVPGGTIGEPSQVSISITDPVVAGAGDFAFSESTLTVSEERQAAVLEVRRSNGSRGEVSLRVRSVGGTATAGSDYTAVNEVLTWSDGDTNPRQIRVAIASDDVSPEPDETITFALTKAPSGVGNEGGDTTDQATISGAAATLTIEDTPVAQPGRLRFVDADLTVRESQLEVTLSVERFAGSNGPVSVNINLLSGTAQNIDDFGAPSSSSLSWAAGESGEKSFTVPIVFDSLVESTEVFTARLANATPASVLGEVAPTATINILDSASDNGTFAFNTAAVSVPRADGTVEVSVQRSGNSNGVAAVRVFSADGSATAGTDYTVVNQIVNWTDGDTADKVITVNLLSDGAASNTDQSPRTFTLRLDDPGIGDSPSDIIIGDPNEVTISIIDPVVVEAGDFAFVQTAVRVREDEQQVMLDVTRSNGSVGSVSDGPMVIRNPSPSALIF